MTDSTTAGSNRNPATRLLCLLLALCLPCLGGCDGQGAFDATIELVDAETLEPAAGVSVEFATVRRREFGDLSPETDDLASAPYGDHGLVTTDADGRFSTEIFVVVGGGFPAIPRCDVQGFFTELWVLRIQTNGGTDVLIIQTDPLSYAPDAPVGASASGASFVATVVDRDCTRNLLSE